MSNNKQSSVEWLIEQVINNNGVNKSTFEQAKAMHKEEIEQAFYEGNHNSVDYFNMEDFSIKDYEQYYNETFGGNNGETMDN